MVQTIKKLNHDLNNPLQNVLGNAQLLQRRLGDHDPEAAEYVSEIIEAARTMTGIVHQLAQTIKSASYDG